METLTNYAVYFGYSLIALALLVVMKYALDFKAKDYYSADEQLNNGNLAIAFRRAGAYFGLGIAVVGVMYGDIGHSLVKDMIDTAIYGILGIAYMIVALVVADKMHSSGIDNKAALRDGNVSVGIMEFGVLVATGIIASASIRLDGGQFYISAIYFLVGQVALLVIMGLYNLKLKKTLELKKAIEKGNLSVGIYVAGKFIAYALLLHASIYNLELRDSASIQALELLTGLGCAILLMILVEILIDWFILTKVTVKEALENDMSTQAMTLAFTKVAMALIIAFTIL